MRYALLLFVPFLLPAQLAFEVASIRPAPPQPIGSRSTHRSTDEGRMKYTGVSVADLISQAYNVLHRQVSGPDWMDTEIFDIAATYPAGAAEKDIPEMLKSLLRDRFGLKLHEESKEMSIYAIMPAKAGVKMRKLESGGGFSGNYNRTQGHITAKTTVANLADNLSGKLDRPVVDQSGLEGFYEIDLQWALDTTDAGAADAGPSIFTAMQEQLGLRLAPVKGPVKLLVVDHADKVPAEN